MFLPLFYLCAIVSIGLAGFLWTYFDQRRTERKAREAIARGEAPPSVLEQIDHDELMEALAREVLRRSRPRSRF
jgi:hypothetical protein